ncbi:MAG TPA: DoxX family protein [Gemmatimonadales bacterium]
MPASTPTPLDISERPAGALPGLGALGPLTHALLRIGAALLFMSHGLQKLFGLFGGFGAPGNTAELASQMGLAGMLETFGGLLLLLGLFTRPVALLLAAEMLVAFFQAHFPRGGVPLENGGEVPLLFMLVFLFFVGNGAGPASIDNRRPTT